MAAWFSVYSPQSLDHVRPADVAAFLDGPSMDWYILAETFGIEDEAVVEQAESALRVEPATGELGEWFEVYYRPEKSRPLVAYRWDEPARVQEELAEVRDEHLAGRSGPGVDTVRTFLSGVVEVAAVELGIFQLEDMGLVIAGQVAEYLAGVSGGIIRDPADEWWAVREGEPHLLAGRE